MSIIFVLYKGKGDPLSPDSYRGISFCSILAKVYERLLLNRLLLWWKSTEHFRSSQFGFRSGSSTIDAVFVLRNIIHFVCRINQAQLHAGFIDLKKAFPLVLRAALFERLQTLGVKGGLIAAIRSFYFLNSSRLRIGCYLSRPFLVTVGLLEGSILSPMLFIIVFSFVWETLHPCPLPDGAIRCRLRGNEIWILAFADDLVILSPSRKKLARSLRLLDIKLRKFNLQMNLGKTETMTFYPRSGPRRSPPPIVLRDVPLKQVDSFKYLGISIDSTGSLQGHVDLMFQRSQAASVKTVELVGNLGITNLWRLKCYFNSFISAQFYGLEVLPFSVAVKICQARISFVRQIFKLPRGTPADLFYVLFPSLTPEILCLQRRLTFYNRCLRHDLLCVPAGLMFDLLVMYKRTCGWLYESFLFYRSVQPSAAFSKFDFAADVDRLLSVTNDERAFSDHYIKNSTEACLSFFRLFPNVRAADSFQNAIGKLNPGYQHVFISFLSSQIRWSFTTPSSSHCPLCHRNAWLWVHFFSCPVILTALSSRNIDITSFKHCAIDARWEEVFSTVANVLLVWHFAINLNCDWLSIEYNRDTFHSALLAVSAVTR
jgi:hypothetical protein